MEKNINIKITSRADGKGFDITTTGLKEVQRESKKTLNSVSMVDKSVHSLVKRVTLWGGGLLAASTGFSALTRAIGSLDGLKEAEGRLRLVSASTYELKNAQEQLLKISNKSRVSYQSSVETYARLGRSLKELEVSSNDLLDVTETINKSIIISGANATSAEAALMQLGQGFAAGALRGEELNSVLDQTPRLAEAIADGMGVGVGQLKELGMQGKLTAEAVFKALMSQKSAVESEFSKMLTTVGQSIVVLKDNFLTTLATLDKGAGFTKSIADAIILLSKNIGTLINTFGFALKHSAALGASFLAAKVATLAFGKASKFAATTSLSAFITSLKNTKTRTNLVKVGLYKARTALRALKATFATFAPTAALFALTEALFFFLDSGTNKADKFRNSISKTTKELENMSKVSLEAHIGGKDGLEARLRFENQEIQRVEKELHRLDNMLKGKKAKYKLADGTLTSDYQQTGKYKDLLHELEQLQDGAKKVKDEIFEAKKALNSIGKKEPSSNNKIDTSEVENYTKTLLSPYQAELDKINEANTKRLELLEKAGADTKDFIKAWELEINKLDKKYEKKPTESKKSTTPIKNYIGEAEELLKAHYERVGDIESLHVKEKEKFNAKVLANTKLTEQEKTDIIASFSKKLTEDFTKQSKEREDRAKKEALERQNLELENYIKTGNYDEAWKIKKKQIIESLKNSKLDANKIVAIQEAKFNEEKTERLRKYDLAYGKVAQGFTEGLIYAQQHLNKLPTEFEKGIEISKTAFASLQRSFSDFFDKQSKNFLDFGKLGKNILNDIANKMLKMQVIDPLAKTGSKVASGFVGFVGTALKEIFFYDGGHVKRGYADGGYTANVGVREVAGVVHGGEYVIPAWQVEKNKTLVQAFEAERVGKRGFWRGGSTRDRLNESMGLGDKDGNYSTLDGESVKNAVKEGVKEGFKGGYQSALEDALRHGHSPSQAHQVAHMTSGNTGSPGDFANAINNINTERLNNFNKTMEDFNEMWKTDFGILEEFKKKPDIKELFSSTQLKSYANIEEMAKLRAELDRTTKGFFDNPYESIQGFFGGLTNFLTNPLKAIDNFTVSLKKGNFEDHVKNFLMDALFSVGGALLGGALGGALGAKLGSVLAKNLSDNIQNSWEGWENGAPIEKIEELSKNLSQQAQNIADTQKGAKHVLETSSKMLDTVAKISSLEREGGENIIALTKLNETYKEQQQQMVTSMQKDVIRNAELLYKDIFAVTAPKLKEGMSLNFQELFKNYTEQGSSALTKTVLDGSLFNTPNFYKTWEEYAKTKNQKVDEVLKEGIGSIFQARDDFERWKLKDNPLELAKHDATKAQKSFEETARNMGIKSAEITKENFLDRYNEAIANSLNPETINNWNNLKSSLMNASNAQEKYIDAIKQNEAATSQAADAMLQKAKSIQNQVISMMNTLGRDSSSYSRKSLYANTLSYVKSNFKGYDNATSDDVNKWISTVKGWSAEKYADYIGRSEQNAQLGRYLEGIISNQNAQRQKAASSYRSSYANNSSYKSTKTKVLNYKGIDNFISALKNTTGALEDVAKSAQSVLDDLHKHDKEYTKKAYKKHINSVDKLTQKLLKNPLDKKIANNYKTAVESAKKYARDFLQKRNFASEWDYRVALGEAKRDWQSIKKQGENAKDTAKILKVLEDVRDTAKNQIQLDAASVKATKDLGFLVEAIAQGRVTITVKVV